ncbi:aminoacyl-tRNA hydrolase [Azospirillum oryzae]|uniref:Aminoacyl-tRNA hydrolase n=1 Tax=Azospirillum oryzae TaxID=286727 RepID=A0A6N1AJ59_9PROT|nr:alternative ribosome rescue aminoacyl-tRNA hydrolase ArfB [Azospirillum oryzae]KAA0589933.1 aminoacyl-tRNA hydrolase [Azospirillum oryzae]QKS51771.1 aminoacyl-tRNA hydrolase [Azospirillum oryzae]GLR81398.1 aminoacyl-tRNA hydrolase [Azospirillum oryzae]
MIRVTHRISLDESELQEEFVRASGPGGQHVNKTDSAVQLRFDVAASPNLPPDVKARLAKLAGSRVTQNGVLLIQADRYRSQRRNRDDALERLIDLIREAAAPPPPPRRPTKPTYGSQQRRLEGKTKRSATKRLRGGPVED